MNKGGCFFRKMLLWQISLMGIRAYKASTVHVSVNGFHRDAEARQRHFDLSSDLEQLIPLCREPDGIARMEGFMLETYGGEKADYNCAIYAIEAQGFRHTKVGISHKPVHRTIGMQTSHFAPLQMVGCVWAADYKAAEKIERLVIRAAKEMRIHARGEWLNATGEEVIHLILKAARFAKAKVCDGDMAMQNLTARATAMADMRGLTAA